MIIPTAKFDPMFAEDGVPFRTKMLRYIQREFADIVDQDVRALQSDSDLAALSDAALVRLQRRVWQVYHPQVDDPSISIRAAS